MKFSAIASSSAGNAYLLESEGVDPLLIEAGIPFKKLRNMLGCKLPQLAGCLVSHEHMDHAKAVKDLLRVGIDCYMSEGTARALDVFSHHRIILTSMSYGLPGWRIKPFDLKHDAAEPLGFLVSHETENLLFIPDTGYMKNRFTGVTIISVECNHISDILNERIKSGSVPAVAGRRIRRNHMSLDTLITMLKANDLSMCREIHLLHLSDGSSDEARMIRTVQEATGIPTYACNK